MDYEEIWSTGCNSCVYYQNCKRLPSDRLGFSHSCFISSDGKAPLGRTLCSDFTCSKRHPAKYKAWQNFSAWQWYNMFGRDYAKIGYVLDNDQSIRYYVNYKDFYSGNLIVDGKFNAVEKMYYKQVRRGFGYELVIEKLENDIDINVEVKQND